MLPHDSGEAGERSETEGADCVAIVTGGFLRTLTNSTKVKSEDLKQSPKLYALSSAAL